MAKRMLAKDLDKYVVRLPDGMRDRLQAAADEKGLSLNAEIVARLEFADKLPSIKADFDLAKQRIVDLQRLDVGRARMIDMMEKALAAAEGREKNLQSQIDRLLEMIEKKLG